jgi:hypothetical protein
MRRFILLIRLIILSLVAGAGRMVGAAAIAAGFIWLAIAEGTFV